MGDERSGDGVSDDAEAEVAPSSERSTRRGQWRASLDEPGWITGPDGGGRFALIPLGTGEHDPLVVVAEFAPGIRLGVHSHDSDYCSIVLEGDVEVTRHPERPGSLRVVAAGTAYGPLEVGPNGARVLEVFADRTAFARPGYVRDEDRSAHERGGMAELADELLRGAHALTRPDTLPAAGRFASEA